MAGGSNSLRDSLLPCIDVIRGVPGALGFRLYTVAVYSRTWTGSRVGLGTNVDTSTGVKIALGLYQTKITQVSERDVIASGNLYSTEDLKVGPITPPFTGSTLDNDAITVFDPVVGASPTEVFFNVKGPGYPATGAWFKKVSQTVTTSLRYTFVVRRTAEIP